ncbi:flavin reductase (NADH) [Neisseria sp. HSC-16F19]|nr:flavin reductase [Neisseria sp. HSC-16F19]MCP2041045.1 flavin reductase (NADH) [Neisseria sp. HSC-16F19]
MSEQQHPLSQPYRNAMATVASGVHVVSTDGADGPHGITMTAVTSVSDNPPTLVLCINRETVIRPLVIANGRVCVNVLAAHQQDVAEHFAGFTNLGHAERFLQNTWFTGPDGLPHLEGALAHLSGRITDHADIGTHTVFYMAVEHIHVNPQAECGLLYFRRHFASVDHV